MAISLWCMRMIKVPFGVRRLLRRPDDAQVDSMLIARHRHVAPGLFARGEDHREVLAVSDDAAHDLAVAHSSRASRGLGGAALAGFTVGCAFPAATIGPALAGAALPA